MPSKKIILPETSRVELKASYVELCADSPLNQNDSHFHPECEIYINLSGKVAFEVENHIYPVSRGSVIITRPFEYHHCIYRSQKRHEHYWITFTAQEEKALAVSLDNAAQAALSIMDRGVPETANRFNGSHP